MPDLAHRDHAENHVGMAEHALADLARLGFEAETSTKVSDAGQVIAAFPDLVDPMPHLARAQIHATLAVAEAMLQLAADQRRHQQDLLRSIGDLR